MSYLLAIDPSVNNCGASVFDIKTKKLVDAILVRPDKIVRQDHEFYDKAFSIFNKIDTIRKKCDIDIIVSERVDHWNVGGFQARESGSTEKLSFICGMLYSLKGSVSKFKFYLPRQWKGQLSKDVTKNRLESMYVGKGKFYTTNQWKELDHNICDSIGIGHFELYGRV